METKKIEIEAFEYVREDGTVGYAPLLFEQHCGMETERKYFIREDAPTAQKIVNKYNEKYLDSATGKRQLDAPGMYRNAIYGGCILTEYIPDEYQGNQPEDEAPQTLDDAALTEKSKLQNELKELSGERIAIAMNDGCKLVAERNEDCNFRNEIFLGIEDSNGCFVQDLAIVRQAYTLNGPIDGANYVPEKYEVLVFADNENEDYTDHFAIDKVKPE